MQINLTDTGKRYNRDWIFRHVDYTFVPGRSYAITGPNGSGKSTLLQVIAGAVLHSEGKVEYYNTKTQGNKELNGDGSQSLSPATEAYKELSIAAPYLDLVEEMTATEIIKFHSNFKTLVTGPSEMLARVGLATAANKQVRYFSSGMKQRLKLALAFFSDTQLLLLDEPTANLDAEGAGLYHRLISDYTRNRLVIVSSNDRHEYEFCEEVIQVNSYR